MFPRPMENLSKRQREETPYLFATHLLRRVREIHNVKKVSCLWVRNDAVYYLLDYTDCWPLKRNANLYPGPNPIIAHPPCGPWGKYRSICKESDLHGINAIELVHRHGGVVEQPVGSLLFKRHGRNGRIEEIEQFDFGHLAVKPTLLYWVDKCASSNCL